jgi:hypothetical protein
MRPSSLLPFTTRYQSFYLTLAGKRDVEMDRVGYVRQIETGVTRMEVSSTSRLEVFGPRGCVTSFDQVVMLRGVTLIDDFVC